MEKQGKYKGIEWFLTRMEYHRYFRLYIRSGYVKVYKQGQLKPITTQLDEQVPPDVRMIEYNTVPIVGINYDFDEDFYILHSGEIGGLVEQYVDNSIIKYLIKD